MLRRLIDFFNRNTCWIKRKRIIKPKGDIIKANIGSGLNVCEDWINVDGSLNSFFSKWPKSFLGLLYKLTGARKHYSFDEYYSILKNHVFVHHDIVYNIPFPDDSIDYLYSSHLLEHLFFEDAYRFLKEVFRVLKKEGIFRVCVPDLEYSIDLYRKGSKKKALSYFFVDSKEGYMTTHKYMYDIDILEELLKNSGFNTIKKCSYKQGKTPDIDILDNRPEETLFLEAYK